MATCGVLDVAAGDLTKTTLDRLLETLTDRSTVAWVMLTPADFVSVAERLGYPTRVTQDMLNGAPPTGSDARQRARVVRFPDYTYFSVFHAAVDEQGGLVLGPVSIFVRHTSLVVVSEQSDVDASDIVDRWQTNRDLLRFGVLALLYGVLDSVVDSHLGTVDQLADSVDSMEDDLFSVSTSPSEDPRAIQMRSFATRKSLVQLRRVTQPMRELVTGTMRHDEAEHSRMDPTLLPYYQDLYDHVLRVNDTIEGLRDLITTIYETRLALFDHTLNTVTRQLAAWAAIIAVPTAVTGFYGQNVPYPGYLHANGFVASTIIWVGGAVLLYVMFKRRRWL